MGVCFSYEVYEAARRQAKPKHADPYTFQASDRCFLEDALDLWVSLNVRFFFRKFLYGQQMSFREPLTDTVQVDAEDWEKLMQNQQPCFSNVDIGKQLVLLLGSHPWFSNWAKAFFRKKSSAKENTRPWVCSRGRWNWSWNYCNWGRRYFRRRTKLERSDEDKIKMSGAQKTDCWIKSLFGNRSYSFVEC